MRGDHSFDREHIVDVDAAVVGVSRKKWEAFTPDEASDEGSVRAVMARKRFDLMPVVETDGEVRSYLKTAAWGDYASLIEQHDVSPQDVIPQRTPLEEVLRGFAEDDRDFYFLSSYGRLTGLVTVVNLNCRQARVFLYGLICEFETAMGDLIRQEIEGGRLTAKEVLAELSEGREDVRDGFATAVAGGVEPDVTEFLYLTDLTKVVRKHGLYGPLGYSDGGRFKNAFAHLNETRRRVAHPTRALIEKREAVKTLWKDVRLIEEAMSHFYWERKSPA